MSIKSILVEVSPGEMIDKITILSIKSERIKDETKLTNVNHELEILSLKLEQEIPHSTELRRLMEKLKLVNEELWDIEDNIRDCERAGNYARKFTDLARAVYKTNDKRARIKRDINLLLGSIIIEEKSYQPY